MWKHACAFTKWVPSNQFMYANLDYNDETMTLERFGFIGMDRRCFWGSIGVLWKRPLPVEQILPNVTALVEPPKPAPTPVPIKLPYDIFEIQSIVNPGETNNDVEIVETEGEEGTEFHYQFKKRVENKYEQHWWFYGVKDTDTFVIQTEKYKNIWLYAEDDGIHPPFVNLRNDPALAGKTAYT
jgi:hypothetical protein